MDVHQQAEKSSKSALRTGKKRQQPFRLTICVALKIPPESTHLCGT
jgi:hypothetical protein